MDQVGGLLGFDDQAVPFCVDDLINCPPIVEAGDFDFVTNWIQTAIDQPSGPLMNPVEGLPFIDLNIPETGALTDPLSSSDSGLDFFSHGNPHNEIHVHDVTAPQKQMCAEEDSIQPTAVPARPSHCNRRLPLRGQAPNIPIREIMNRACIQTTKQHTSFHPRNGLKSFPEDPFPFDAVIGEAGLSTNLGFDNCRSQIMTTPPRGAKAQTGTPLTISSLSPGPGQGYDEVQPSCSPMNPPPLEMSCAPDFHFSPDHSTPSTFTPSSITHGTLHSALFRMPSASSGTSYVTQASLPVSRAETPRDTAKAKNRYSKGASASNYCHVCGRNSRIEFAVCANTRLGLCRKVVCDKCLLLYQRDCYVVAKDPNVEWKCTHCRNVCPPRARCKQYTKNNHRRRARKAEAALREAQNRQRAQQNRQRAPQNRQQVQQNRRQAQKKPQQSQNQPPPPQSLPQAPGSPQDNGLNMNPDDEKFSPHVQASLASPSSQQDSGQGMPFLMECAIPLPAEALSPVNAKKRGYSHITEPPNPVNTQNAVAARLQMHFGGQAAQPKIERYVHDEKPGAPVIERVVKRRRMSEPSEDGISPVSIANIMMSGNDNSGNFLGPDL